MRIAIIGTGGVGGYFGGKLAKAGNNVTFLARGKHLKAMLEHGLQVNSVLGDFLVQDIRATDKITDIQHPELIILGVKAWQIEEIRDNLKKITYPDTVILPLQNGVLAADELAEKIDKANIVGGLCRIISKIEAPGVISHEGVTPAIVFGELDKSKSQRTEEIQKCFEEAGIKSKVSEDIEAELWKKFITICISGLLAVSNTTYGVMRGLKETRQMMIDLLKEIYLLSQKIGINIEPGFLEKTISFMDSLPYDSTASLTRDVWEGKPSEIEYQNGTVVRLGEKYGVDTPINRFVYNCILPGEFKARGLRI